MDKNGYSLVDALIVLVVLAVIGLGSYLVYSHENKASPTKTQSASNVTEPSVTSAYVTLSPATVPSKTPECTEQISYSSNGVPGPVQCSNGDLNASDWAALAALEPAVMSLGYSATASQVQSDLCSDVSADVSNPIEATVYQISALYYGWNFSSNPSVVLTNGTCQNVDD